MEEILSHLKSLGCPSVTAEMTVISLESILSGDHEIRREIVAWILEQMASRRKELSGRVQDERSTPTHSDGSTTLLCSPPKVTSQEIAAGMKNSERRSDEDVEKSLQVCGIDDPKTLYEGPMNTQGLTMLLRILKGYEVRKKQESDVDTLIEALSKKSLFQASHKKGVEESLLPKELDKEIRQKYSKMLPPNPDQIKAIIAHEMETKAALESFHDSNPSDVCNPGAVAHSMSRFLEKAEEFECQFRSKYMRWIQESDKKNEQQTVPEIGQSLSDLNHSIDALHTKQKLLRDIMSSVVAINEHKS